MQRTYKITGYGTDRNPDGTLRGKVRVRISLEVDVTKADADVVKSLDGTEETIIGTLISHVASQAARETGLTLTESDISHSP